MAFLKIRGLSTFLVCATSGFRTGEKVLKMPKTGFILFQNSDFLYPTSALAVYALSKVLVNRPMAELIFGQSWLYTHG